MITRKDILDQMIVLQKASRDLAIMWDCYIDDSNDLELGTKDYPFPDSFDVIAKNIKVWVTSTIIEETELKADEIERTTRYDSMMKLSD